MEKWLIIHQRWLELMEKCLKMRWHVVILVLILEWLMSSIPYLDAKSKYIRSSSEESGEDKQMELMQKRQKRRCGQGQRCRLQFLEEDQIRCDGKELDLSVTSKHCTSDPAQRRVQDQWWSLWNALRVNKETIRHSIMSNQVKSHLSKTAQRRVMASI